MMEIDTLLEMHFLITKISNLSARIDDMKIERAALLVEFAQLQPKKQGGLVKDAPLMLINPAAGATG